MSVQFGRMPKGEEANTVIIPMRFSLAEHPDGLDGPEGFVHYLVDDRLIIDKKSSEAEIRIQMQDKPVKIVLPTGWTVEALYKELQRVWWTHQRRS